MPSLVGHGYADVEPFVTSLLRQEQPKEAQFPSGPWKLGGTRLSKLLPPLFEFDIVWSFDKTAFKTV